MNKTWMPTLAVLLVLQNLGVAAEIAGYQEAVPRLQFAEPTACCPSWYAQTDAIFYTRDRADRRAISADIDFTGTATVLMSTDAMNFDYQPGVRLTLGRQFGSNAVELSYFGIEQYTATAQITSAEAPNGTLHSPVAGFDAMLTAAPFDGADLHSVSYSSNLHNAEINFRHAMPARGSLEASWLVGVRYMKIRERFDFRAAMDDFMGGGPGNGLLGAVTVNDMLGVQLGGDVLWRATQRFGVQAGGKGALLGNSAVQRQYSVYDMPPPMASFRDDASASDQRLSSVLEASLFGFYQITPRVRLRAGYQVLVVGGLALAPTQLNFGDDPDAYAHVKLQGSTVFHGPSCGLEASW